MNVAFRDVNSEVFRMFKAESARLGIKMGTAVSEAFRYWMELKKKKEKKGSFFDLKPWDWGKGCENASQEIDEYLYGWKK